METPGVDEGYDAVNMRPARGCLHRGATALPELPPKAFRTSRRSTRTGIGSIASIAKRQPAGH